MVNGQNGYRLQRGDGGIACQREDRFFTVALNRNSDEPRVRALLSAATTVRVRRLGRTDLKVEVAADNDLAPLMQRLRAEGLSCQHAYRPVGSAGTRFYIGDQVCVKVADHVGLGGAETLLESRGIPARNVRKLMGPGCTVVARLHDSAQVDALALAADLGRQAGVVYAEPDTIERFQPYPAAALAGDPTNPDQHFTSYQWHLDSQPLLQRAPKLDGILNPDAGISAAEAWAVMQSRGRGRGRRDVVVGIIDEGFDLMHPDLDRARLVDALNLEDVGPGPIDSDAQVESAWHGTPCAGLAIAGSAAAGVFGVAPECGFIVARKKFEGRISDMRQAFARVGGLVDVLSWSFSLVPSTVPLPQPLDEIFTQLSRTGGRRGNGCVLCFAAGNWNAPLDNTVTNLDWRKKPAADSPVQRFTGRCFNGYAAHPGVLAVAACTSTGRRARYSNFGLPVALCAPSNNYDPLSADPFSDTTSVQSLGIVTADNEREGEGYNPGSFYTGLTGKTAFGGTSAAAPQVAGVAALVRSVNPDLSAERVRGLLRDNATRIGAENGGDAAQGTEGEYRQGHSIYFGHGRVNAAAAVRAAFETLNR